MFTQPYEPHELRFAYCYRIFLRVRTRSLRFIPKLAQLNRATLNDLVVPYGLHVLHCAADPTDLLTLISLQPTEAISAAVSKLKGRVSKWLAKSLNLDQPSRLLSKGYFACTVGKTRRDAVDRYLRSQAAHHNYDRRPLPPVFVQQYEFSTIDLQVVSPKHAMVIAEFHIVLATRYRKGVFGSQEGLRVTNEWRRLRTRLPVLIRKVSFVPDHVHIAVRCHPSVAPATIVVELMNSAQQVVRTHLIAAGLNRLWEPSAYIGSYGSLASPQLRKYIERWKRTRESE